MLASGTLLTCGITTPKSTSLVTRVNVLTAWRLTPSTLPPPYCRHTFTAATLLICGTNCDYAKEHFPCDVPVPARVCWQPAQGSQVTVHPTQPRRCCCYLPCMCRDSADLRNHYAKEHFPCNEGECADSLVAFPTEAELKAHKLERHSSKMPRFRRWADEGGWGVCQQGAL